MLDELIAPYQRIDVPRIIVTGDDPLIDDRSATPLALTFHELATNATKYGALSRDDGSVSINIACDNGRVEIDWQEHGAVGVKAPQASGFGTRLIELSIERQLGGTIVRDWQPSGFCARICIPLSAMDR